MNQFKLRENVQHQTYGLGQKNYGKLKQKNLDLVMLCIPLVGH